MHVTDGILPIAVCAGGYAISGLASWYSLKKINEKKEPKKGIPKASLGTAAFLAASLIYIPVPPTSVHLLLIGLMGILLEYYAFPAILISLLFQAIMFQHGGLTTLGVNAVIMGLPAMLCHYIYKHTKRFTKNSNFMNGIIGFSIGAIGVIISVLLFYIVITNFIPAHLDVETEKKAVYTLTIAYIPLAFIEGIFTSLLLIYLKKVKPEMLEGY
jgi:cobalt/nickel transport system permease protein